jgi:hypothetical protein
MEKKRDSPDFANLVLPASSSGLCLVQSQPLRYVELLFQGANICNQRGDLIRLQRL